MEAILAGLFAAGTAYILNRILINKLGNIAMVIIIPILEEMLKSFIPALLGASLFFSHATFGTVEAVYEIYTTRNTKAVFGGIISFIFHLLLGALTLLFMDITGSLILSVFAAAVIHSIWNRMITNIYNR